MNSDRLNILDIWVDPVSMEEAIARVRSFLVLGERPHLVFAANPEKNFSVPANPLLHEAYRTADLLIPDGIGIVKAAGLLHGRKLSRVPGVELMHRICSLAATESYPVFFYGGTEEVSRVACERLVRLYPGLTIAGRSNGYVAEPDMAALVREINESGARILFLALGSPRQEAWLTAHAGSLSGVRVCQGIGGSLDVIAGKVKRAPELWCRLNLEWLYRLLEEPARIKRQKVLPLFAARVLSAKLRSMVAPAKPL